MPLYRAQPGAGEHGQGAGRMELVELRGDSRDGDDSEMVGGGGSAELFFRQSVKLSNTKGQSCTSYRFSAIEQAWGDHFDWNLPAPYII